MMSALSPIVTRLYSKVKRLVFLHKKLQEDNMKLIKEREELLKIVQQDKNTILKLEEKNKVIKLAKSLSETRESPGEIKLKINELVREIDKCIALLNK